MVKHTSSLLCIVNVTILYVTSQQQQKTVFFHIHKPTTLFSSETEKKSAKLLQNPQLR